MFVLHYNNDGITNISSFFELGKTIRLCLTQYDIQRFLHILNCKLLYS